MRDVRITKAHTQHTNELKANENDDNMHTME